MLLLFGALPYLEELWRCWRTHPTLAAHPLPPQAATETLRLSEQGPAPVVDGHAEPAGQRSDSVR